MSAPPQRGRYAQLERAAYGSATARMMLKLDPALLKAVRAAAKTEGVPFSEWLRRAARVRLGWPEK